MSMPEQQSKDKWRIPHHFPPSRRIPGSIFEGQDPSKIWENRAVYLAYKTQKSHLPFKFCILGFVLILPKYAHDSNSKSGQQIMRSNLGYQGPAVSRIRFSHIQRTHKLSFSLFLSLFSLFLSLSLPLSLSLSHNTRPNSDEETRLLYKI